MCICFYPQFGREGDYLICDSLQLILKRWRKRSVSVEGVFHSFLWVTQIQFGTECPAFETTQWEAENVEWTQSHAWHVGSQLYCDHIICGKLHLEYSPQMLHSAHTQCKDYSTRDYISLRCYWLAQWKKTITRCTKSCDRQPSLHSHLYTMKSVCSLSQKL